MINNFLFYPGVKTLSIKLKVECCWIQDDFRKKELKRGGVCFTNCSLQDYSENQRLRVEMCIINTAEMHGHWFWMPISAIQMFPFIGQGPYSRP